MDSGASQELFKWVFLSICLLLLKGCDHWHEAGQVNSQNAMPATEFSLNTADDPWSFLPREQALQTALWKGWALGPVRSRQQEQDEGLGGAGPWEQGQEQMSSYMGTSAQTL